jgi:hypothetical protein
MIPINSVIKYVSALLVPKVVFLLLKWTSEYKGAAAITSRLKEISMNIGMEEGIGVYVLLGVLVYQFSDYCTEKYFARSIEHERLENKLLTVAILKRLDNYQISNSLRIKLKAKYSLQDILKKDVL